MGSCLEVTALCPQHIPRTRNVPPSEQGTEPMKTSIGPNPGEETCLTSQPRSPDPPYSLSGAPPMFFWLGHGCRAVPPDRALPFSPHPLQCPASPPRTSGPCPSPPMWPSSPGRSPHAALSMASSKAIGSSSGHSTWMGVSLPGVTVGSQGERCRLRGSLCPCSELSIFPWDVKWRPSAPLLHVLSQPEPGPGWVVEYTVTSMLGEGCQLLPDGSVFGNDWRCDGASGFF